MTAKQFCDQWLRAFACDVPAKDIEKYVKSPGNYIWHVFSWGLLDKNQYLSGAAAKNAYDAMDKSDAVYIDWFGDQQVKDLTEDLSASEAVDRLTEVYIASKNFQWTYIKTHEDMCGPYFIGEL